VLLVAVLALSLEVDAQIVGGPSALSDQLASPVIRTSSLDIDSLMRDRELVELYEENGHAPVWVQFGAPRSRAIGLLHELQNSSAMGLEPSDYDAELLARTLEALQSNPMATEQSWLEWDVALSRAALKFFDHVHQGRIDPVAAGFNLTRTRQAIDLSALLDQVSRGRDIANLISAIEPQFIHYRLLKRALQRYRRLANAESTVAVPQFAATSSAFGSVIPAADALRERLEMLGDLPLAVVDVSASDAAVDAQLVAALKSFQQRHGLEADGVVGSETLEALSTPLSDRVRQIELSLERWRWLPEFESPPIIVNVPQFRLYAFPSADDREDRMLRMNVVVGRAVEEMRTPVFQASLQHVVFRPYWDVPYSITVREMLPRMEADPGYLQEHHMEIVIGGQEDAVVLPPDAANIALLASGEARLRQLPGADNALGDIKFILPNPHNVYLHSTPAPQLFQRAQRAFSHGCIRVSDPAALAAYVLRNETGEWTPERISRALSGPANQKVMLRQPIDVMILYSTAIADESGRVYFSEDIYGHDRTLQGLLGLEKTGSAAR